MTKQNLTYLPRLQRPDSQRGCTEYPVDGSRCHVNHTGNPVKQFVPEEEISAAVEVYREEEGLQTEARRVEVPRGGLESAGSPLT